MRWYSRLKVYKASNVSFSPETLEARSYDWWVFVKRINGKVVFNWHSYSNSTRKHQYKVYDLLKQLGIKIDVTVDTRASLSGVESIKDSMILTMDNIARWEKELLNPRCHKQWRQERIKDELADLVTLNKMFKLPYKKVLAAKIRKAKNEYKIEQIEKKKLRELKKKVTNDNLVTQDLLSISGLNQVVTHEIGVR